MILQGVINARVIALRGDRKALVEYTDGLTVKQREVARRNLKLFLRVR